MKKLNFSKSVFFIFVLGLISFSSCDKGEICDDVTCPTGYLCDNGNCIIDPNATPSVKTETKSGAITTNETWSAENIYELAGKVIVQDGVTLTIEAGTIIKGRQGQGSLASALVVARGGKLLAEGTVEKPIIFTSTLDNIKVGEKTGTNLKETDHSKWGGVIILGKANVSAKIGDTEAQIEGIPADEVFGKYGGNDDSDNSGILKYVSIRHGGTLIGEGNEINGLTLGGVGSGTTINHIEIVGNLDDGIECFGGSVNIEYALVAYQQDDAFDIDQNFSGSFKNSVVIYDNTGDEFLEIDGPENSTNVGGLFTIENCTFISKTGDGSVDMKSKAQGTIKNCKFEGLTKFKLSASFKKNCTEEKTDAYTHYVANPATLIVKDNNTNAPISIYTKSEDGEHNGCPISDEMKTAVETIFSGANNNSNAAGADLSEFDGWTWAKLNGKL